METSSLYTNPLYTKLLDLNSSIGNGKRGEIERYIDDLQPSDFAERPNSKELINPLLIDTFIKLTSQSQAWVIDLGNRFISRMPASKKKDKMARKLLMALSEIQGQQQMKLMLYSDIKDKKIQKKCADLVSQKTEETARPIFLPPSIKLPVYHYTQPPKFTTRSYEEEEGAIIPTQAKEHSFHTQPFIPTRQEILSIPLNQTGAMAYANLFEEPILDKIMYSLEDIFHKKEYNILPHLAFLNEIYPESEIEKKLEGLLPAGRSGYETAPQLIGALIGIGKELAAKEADEKKKNLLLHWALTLKVLRYSAIEDVLSTVKSISPEYINMVTNPKNEDVKEEDQKKSAIIQKIDLSPDVQEGVDEIKKLNCYPNVTYFLLFPVNQALAQKFFKGQLAFSVQHTLGLQNFIKRAYEQINAIEDQPSRKAAICWIVALDLTVFWSHNEIADYVNCIEDEDLKRMLLGLIDEVRSIEDLYKPMDCEDDDDEDEGVEEMELPKPPPFYGIPRTESFDTLGNIPSTLMNSTKQALFYINAFEEPIRSIINESIDVISKKKEPLTKDDFPFYLKFLEILSCDPNFAIYLSFMVDDIHIHSSGYIEKRAFIRHLITLGENLAAVADEEIKDKILHWVLVLKILCNCSLVEHKMTLQAISFKYRENVIFKESDEKIDKKREKGKEKLESPEEKDLMRATRSFDFQEPNPISWMKAKEAAFYVESFEVGVRDMIRDSLKVIFERREYLSKNAFVSHLQFLNHLYLPEFIEKQLPEKIVSIIYPDFPSSATQAIGQYAFIASLIKLGETLAEEDNTIRRDILLHWILVLKILRDSSLEDLKHTLDAMSLEYKATVTIPKYEDVEDKEKSEAIQKMAHLFPEDLSLFHEIQEGLNESKKIIYHGDVRFFFLFPKNQALAERFFKGQLPFLVEAPADLGKFINRALHQTNSIEDKTFQRAGICWLVALDLTCQVSHDKVSHFVEKIQDEDLKRMLLELIDEVKRIEGVDEIMEVEEEQKMEIWKSPNTAASCDTIRTGSSRTPHEAQTLNFTQARHYASFFGENESKNIWMALEEIRTKTEFSKQDIYRSKIVQFFKSVAIGLEDTVTDVIGEQSYGLFQQSPFLDRKNFISLSISLGEFLTQLIDSEAQEAKDILLHCLLTLKVLQNSSGEECEATGDAISNDYKMIIASTVRQVDKEISKAKLIEEKISLFDEEFNTEVGEAMDEILQRLSPLVEIGYLLSLPKNKALAQRFFPDRLKFSIGDRQGLWDFLQSAFEQVDSIENKNTQKAAICWLMALHLACFEEYQKAHTLAKVHIQDDVLKGHFFVLITQLNELSKGTKEGPNNEKEKARENDSL